MPFRPARLLTLVPSVGIGLMVLSPKAMGIASAILLIGVLITLHELGHFLAAKWMKTPVDVFSIGFGPRLIGFRFQETDVRLSAIPLGGYVKLQGETDEMGAGDAGLAEFMKQPFHKRVLFYSGGILANILAAWVLLVAVSTQQVRVTAVHAEPSPLLVLEVVKGGAAEQGGLREGDLITAFGDLRFPGSTDQEARATIKQHANQPLALEGTRLGSPLKLTITPRLEGGVGRLGIQFQPSRIRYERRPFAFKDLGLGLKGATLATGAITKQTVQAYTRLLTFRTKASEVSGPIGIVKQGSQMAQAGWLDFFTFAAFLSLNLAVLNALPIPGLDGSHIAILTFEKVRGKEISLQLKEKIFTVGFFFLLGVLVLVVGKDLLAR